MAMAYTSSERPFSPLKNSNSNPIGAQVDVMKTPCGVSEMFHKLEGTT